MASRTLLEFLSLNRSQLSPPNATTCDGAREAWALLHRVLPTWIIVICVCGLLGNLFVLSVFLLPRRRLNVAEIYLANLAASDLVFVLGLPFWAENIANQFHWPFGGLLCRLVNGVIKANLFISIFLVVAISQDRYRVLVHPMASRRRRRRRRAQATCLLIWLVGGLLSVPTFLFRSLEAVPELNNSYACVLLHPPGPWPLARMVELNVLGFLGPLAAIVFFNCHILASLHGQAEVQGTRCGGPTGGKTTALILTLVAAFLVCWTPYHFFAFLEFLYQMRAVRGCFWEDFIDLGLQYTNFFAFINSCLNPVIYVFVGRLFRTKAWELYQQCTPRSLTPVSLPHRTDVLQHFWQN
ncbi:B1 bradykinin receptor [Ursus maritimus]|uniref:B1 bradykinin receptor n=1 Tax=Ursus maritimus TaxID=29073 RepID=A0A8M1GRK9_URSMA|nr:B1 bradykinin receptor [Ursus arctos]XP_040497404.1 B1 bradykinin receptor [Ursus maritimus]XP_040497405.1 B1 bradykinin receptor [Ursus maritimus]XP_040497406.1 B1 bradykinin receptor [Ursus maritimus]XP_040497407.1 B1 bradykinin receptor [Ursus maritimus]XP_057174364.1 B1 bradykinin receptor [Ursus arctos]